jgi:hypothetical protein
MVATFSPRSACGEIGLTIRQQRARRLPHTRRQYAERGGAGQRFPAAASADQRQHAPALG